MSGQRVGAHELMVGDIVSRCTYTQGTVTEVREATHALAAAHGAYAVSVVFPRHWTPYDMVNMTQERRDELGSEYVYEFTAFPGDTFIRYAVQS